MWIALSMAILFIGLVWLRCHLGSEPPEEPVESVSAPVEEPAPFPESPPEEKMPPVETGESPPPPAEYGDLPDLPPPPVPSGGPPRIALVLDDVGYRMDLVQQASETLPRSVTFAVIPFLPYSEEAAEALHSDGFPVLLHQPMEPLQNHRWKQTSHTLLVGMPGEEVENILNRSLGAVPHAEGVNNHMGSRATADQAMMVHLMSFLKSRELFFLDSRTTAQTVAYDTARRFGVPTAQRAVFLDDTDDYHGIIKQIDDLAARALKEGDVVGIGHIRPNTLRALGVQIPHWRSRGIQFIPLREMVR